MNAKPHPMVDSNHSAPPSLPAQRANNNDTRSAGGSGHDLNPHPSAPVSAPVPSVAAVLDVIASATATGADGNAVWVLTPRWVKEEIAALFGYQITWDRERPIAPCPTYAVGNVTAGGTSAPFAAVTTPRSAGRSVTTGSGGAPSGRRSLRQRHSRRQIVASATTTTRTSRSRSPSSRASTYGRPRACTLPVSHHGPRATQRPGSSVRVARRTSPPRRRARAGPLLVSRYMESR